MEQQFPFGQSPQTVPPYELPQVPFVVTGAVAVDSGGAVDETGTITGSPDVVGAVVVVTVVAVVVVELLDVHPL